MALMLLPLSAVEAQSPDSARLAAGERALGARELFARLLADSSSSADDLERAGAAALLVSPRDWRRSYADAMRLADRGVALGLAELIARKIYREAVDWNVVSRAAGRMAQDEVVLQGHTAAAAEADAIGWIRFKQGHLAEAEQSLKHAVADDPRFAPALYHAGRVAEARGRAADAEWDYARGVLAERGTGTHDNEAALRRLIGSRRGDGATVEGVVAALIERDRAVRKGAVLASRLARPHPMPPFRLARLDGDSLSSDALSGKVLLVDFWGLWCSPCLAELPDLQEVHTRYRADPEVVVLTIAGHNDARELREFMSARSYTFPVLLNGDYASRAGVTFFPTTWIVGKDGSIAFELGSGPLNVNFAEEIAWRIEALKGRSSDHP